MNVILFILFSGILYTVISQLNRKNYKLLIESQIVEIIYLSLSVVLTIILHVRSQIVFFMLLMLGLYEVIKFSERELSREKHQIILYQMFSFINNQVRAGLRMEDVIVGLYQIVDEKKMRENIRKYGLVYAQNYDLEKYLNQLGNEFSIEDFTAIDYAIRNSVNIGFNENIMTFQEDMMFNRYIGIIKKRGDRSKLKMLLAGMLLSMVFFIQIGYPIYLEFMTSLENIY